MKLYDSATRSLREFVPITPGKVGIYGCGPTVYNYIHVGNARAFFVVDLLRRWLTARGYDVTLVANFTDIDDKMINRANELGITVKELGDQFIAAYIADTQKLGLTPATVHPRATEHIGQMIALIKKLEAKGLAYAVDGDVYFSTQDYPEYGQLCGQDMELLQEGARIEPGSVKRHPMDFALWKAAKPGEPSWPSPWGEGRPGWHIECSAMSMKYLGETIDIHCGGEDLLFPHHENECAQSRGATGKPLANYWVHNGFLTVASGKMSKSAGNFRTLHDCLAEFPGEVVRMFFMSAHYRTPLLFSPEQLASAKSAWERLGNFRDNLTFALSTAPAGDLQPEWQSLCDAMDAAFTTAMDEDLNAADAMAALFEMVRTGNTLLQQSPTRASLQAALAALQQKADILGLLQYQTEVTDPAALDLLEQRAAARAAKDWPAADKIRDQLAALGYTVEDTAQGAKLKAISKG